ncbi:MAG: hypothetical protein CVU24_17820 [Betaproteobacteria bacterium HGW-Betaproteobacteria-18]|nr:MAG: hypothetical protein CVU24_17820 [Betaproteobacteria bacterium HGW-Betaproteobacteria-18]
MGRAFGGGRGWALLGGIHQRHEASSHRVGIADGAEHAAPAADKVGFLKDPEIANDGWVRNAQRRLEHEEGAGPVQQLPEKKDPTGMRQGDGKKANGFILRMPPLVKGELQRQQKRTGTGHLGIRGRQIPDERGMALDADQTSGLQASKLLAGAGKANLGVRGQPGDGRARLGQDETKQAQPSGASQHPARSPERGVQLHEKYPICFITLYKV